MVRNQEKYEQAVQFRKRGFTLEEIAKLCDISKSTASKWLKNKAFSETVTKQNKRRAGQDNAKRLKLMSKTRTRERLNRYKEAERSAVTEFKHYKSKPRFIAGLMIYLTQGDLNAANQIRLSSQDIVTHKIFIKFLTEYLGVDKRDIHCWLLLYQGQKEAPCLEKWKKTTGLSYSQFYKTQFTKTKKSANRLHYGVGNTIIGSTVLKRKLLKWIELVQKELAK